MGMVPVADESGPRIATGGPPPESRDVPNLLGSALLEGNSAVSAMARIYNSGTFAPMPGYNPLAEIKDTPYFENYADRFAGSRSPAETANIQAQISREEAAKKDVADSGALGTVAGLVAGAVDPVWLLALGIPGTPLRGISAVKEAFASGGLVRTGALTAAGMSAQEALLHASQETRGFGESVQNVAVGTLLWALVGGGAARLLHTEGKMPEAEAALDKARSQTEAHVTETPLASGQPLVKKKGDGQFEMSVRSEDGETVGKVEFSVTDDAVVMRYPFVETEFQGQGLGLKAYQAVVDWALAHGKEFRSDSSISPSAVRIYDALERRGYKVIRPDEARPQPLGIPQGLPSKSFAVGNRAISDFVESGKTNAWIDVPEGKIYLRNRRGTIDVANIDFETKGTGAFTAYLRHLEDMVLEKKADTIRIENVFNDRLIQFLENRAYVREGTAEPPTYRMDYNRLSILERKVPSTLQPQPLGDHDALQQAYDQIKEKQNGISTVFIGDIIERSGLPKEQVIDALRRAAEEGNATLHESSVPEGRLSKARLEGALDIDGRQLRTVVVKNPIGASASTKPHSGEPFRIVAGPATRAGDFAPPTPAPAGAAYSDTRNLSPAPYGLEALPGVRSFASKMFPNLDVLENGADVTKRAVAEMAEIPIATRGNVAGETTTLRGGPAADREINMFREAKMSGLGREMMRLWTEYLGADAQPGLLGKAQRMMGRAPEGKLSFDEFDAAVGDALRLQDQHEIPQVQAMAQWLRREVYEPVSKRAEAAIDGFKPIEPRDGESYAPQIWAKDLIKSRWNAFVDMWTNHLTGQQAVKAAIKEKLEFYNAQLQSWEKQISKLDARFERAEERTKALDARAAERSSDELPPPLRGYVDTRAGGRQFHGAANEVDLTEGHYGSSTAFYGTQSLYTSDAIDVVHGYANRRGSKSPSIYEVQGPKNAKIYDMEAPIPPEVRAKIDEIVNDPHGQAGEVAENALSDNPKNLREFFDEARGYAASERIPADEIQEGLFHPLQDFLEGHGYHGMSHRGGAVTKTPAHNVVIYFSPEKNVQLRKIGQQELAGMKQPGTKGRAELLEERKAEIHAEAKDLADSIDLMESLVRQNPGLAPALARANAMLERRGIREQIVGAQQMEASRTAQRSEKRLAALENQLSKVEDRKSLIEEYRAIAEEFHNEVRDKIEKELGNWEGKSAGEAKSAIKTREKYATEAAAAGKRTTESPRLESADAAVDRAVKRIIESDRDLSRQELKSRAQEIGLRTLSTPEGRLPYDEHLGGPEIGIPHVDRELRGHTAHRAIDLPYDVAQPWLERSATRQTVSYMHSVLPDAVLAERFGGDPNMTVKFKEIADAYADKAARYTSERELKRIADQRDSDMQIVAGMRDRIRGVFGYDQGSNTARVAQGALKINNIISSHMMAVSSLPDFAGAVFRHAFESGFGEAWSAYARGLFDNEAWAALKAQGHELQAMGIGIETERAARQHALDGITESYRPNSRVERALSWASDKSFIVNLLTPLTDVQKRISANVAMNGVLRASQAIVEGKATQKQLIDLAAGNIRPDVAERIWKAYSEGGGEQVKGVYLPNTAAWADVEAKMAFQAAVARDVDIAVVTPGQEKPFWMSKPGWNLLGQYSTFAISATQRIVIANLQRADAATLAGLVTAVGMGMLAYRINTAVSGQPVSDRPADWFKEGVSRGGVLGAIDNANTITSKLTGGRLDIYRAIGADKPLSKVAGRNAAEVLLGPTYGKVQNLARATSVAGRMDWTEADTHALRMALMGSNLPYLPRLFDQAEVGFNSAFGIPMKAKPQ